MRSVIGRKRIPRPAARRKARIRSWAGGRDAGNRSREAGGGERKARASRGTAGGGIADSSLLAPLLRCEDHVGRKRRILLAPPRVETRVGIGQGGGEVEL